MALAALGCLVALLSPAFSVRHVVWSGHLRPAAARCQALEAASHGRPLYLLPERELRGLLRLDADKMRIRFARHAPGTLEVRVTPRRAAMQMENGVVLDGRGRVLAKEHALPGLLRVGGFGLAEDGKCLEPEASRCLERVQEALQETGLALSRLERRNDDLVLLLTQPETRVLLSVQHLEAGLDKLSLVLPMLAQAPARLDLRFRDQIVVEQPPRGARHGRG